MPLEMVAPPQACARSRCNVRLMVLTVAVNPIKCCSSSEAASFDGVEVANGLTDTPLVIGLGHSSHDARSSPPRQSTKSNFGPWRGPHTERSSVRGLGPYHSGASQLFPSWLRQDEGTSDFAVPGLSGTSLWRMCWSVLIDCEETIASTS